MLRGERSLKEAAASLCSALAQLGDLALDDDTDSAAVSTSHDNSGSGGSAAELKPDLCSKAPVNLPRDERNGRASEGERPTVARLTSSSLSAASVLPEAKSAPTLPAARGVVQESEQQPCE